MSKKDSIWTREEENKRIFEALVKNAFEFFYKSISEFNTAPKYAVIHFSAAVENILKSRLMCEHWSLVASKPDQITRKKFISGDFSSVSFYDAVDRLCNIACCHISKPAVESFKKIIHERNKAVHFYNKNFINKEEKIRIAEDEYRAWYYIDELLKSWVVYFYDFDKEIKNIRRLMSTHSRYFEVKYNEIGRCEDKIKSNNYIVSECNLCGNRSLVYPNGDELIVHGQCEVCDHTRTGLLIKCPFCHKDLVIDSHTHTCIHCSKFYGDMNTKNVLAELFSYEENKEDEVDWIANCSSCGEWESAILLPDGKWFCLTCGEVADKVSRCDARECLYTGEKKDTAWNGCGCASCEGILVVYSNNSEPEVFNVYHD